MPHSRILVVGTTGSGKTTFARRLSAITGIPHLEIDSIYHLHGWTPAPEDEVVTQLRTIAARDQWIVDGNYTQYTGATLWPRADTVVWLDFALPRVLARLTLRTARRLLRRTPLWNGNRETFGNLFKSDSILLWALTTHYPNRKKYSGMLRAHPHIRAIHCIHPEDAEHVLINAPHILPQTPSPR